jgi:hypothetical protein
MIDRSSLDQEIELARRQISTDGYPMSIGELTNIYREEELVIQPAFQRLFRWDAEQRSRLIESILLGIPLPSVFVSQAQDGKWELIDGLQRISTILQVQGLLRGSPPLTLIGTKYLPALEGMSWDGPNPLPDAIKLDFKRTKIDLKIIRRESDPNTKYDLFQRLNSYGSPLTAQEMRHALLVSISPEFSDWVGDLARNRDFMDTVALPEKLLAEKYDEELILRFIYLHQNEDISAGSLRRFGQKLDDAAVEFAENMSTVGERVTATFESTFEILEDVLGPNAFRKWNPTKDRFEGGFSNTAFEVLAMGLGYHIANDLPYRTDLERVAQDFWSTSPAGSGFATGMSTERRLSRTIRWGRSLLEERPGLILSFDEFWNEDSTSELTDGPG